MFEFIFEKNTAYLGGYLIEFVVIVCFFFLFEGNEWGEGTSVTWDALIFVVWALLMEICAAGEGLWLFLCVRPWTRFPSSCSGSWPVSECWEGRGQRVGWACAPCLWVPESPAPLSLFCHLRTPGQPLSSEPPHSCPAAGSPPPLSLVLGSSWTLPVSFLSLDSQGGFSSCVSSC